ncbi:hypothetical protein L0Y59_03065, partial [Candidatus Uhrbacteria bacterium]|nr:hypothetical protein [Candidatus Uhrbacteria bacterium]
NTTVGGQAVCLQDGTNCPAGGTESDTLASVTNRGNYATSSVLFYGGLTTSNLTATGTTSLQAATLTHATATTLSVSGLSDLDDVLFVDATGTHLALLGLLTAPSASVGNLTWTNATGTRFVATYATTTNLYAETGTFLTLNASSLNLAGLTWTNATGTNTTSTNSYATNATAGSFTSGSVTTAGLTFGSATGTSATTTNLATTNLLVDGKKVCLQDGTNCPSSSGGPPYVWSGYTVGGSTLTINVQLLVATVTTTPSSATNQMWIVVGSGVKTNSNTDSTATMYIRRGTSCTEGTLVGVPVTGGISTSAESTSLAASLVDTPGTTSSTTYSVCLMSGITGPVTEPTTITVQEVRFGADLGEVYYADDATLAPGEVVALDPAMQDGVMRSASAYDERAIGVVSTKPGLLLSDRPKTGGTPVIVALAGRIPVNVTAMNGTIAQGDYLTSSPIPGVAMKATKAGNVIGQAMTSFDGEGTGQVMMFVKNGSFGGAQATISATETGRDILSRIAQQTPTVIAQQTSDMSVDRLVADIDVTAPTVTANTVSTDRLLVMTTSTFVGLADFTGGIVVEGEASFLDAVLFGDDVRIGGALAVDGTATVSHLSALTIESPVLEDLAASASLALGRLDALSLAVDELRADVLAAQEGLQILKASVTSELALTQAAASEALEVSGGATIAGGLTVDAVTPLGAYLAMRGDVMFFGRPYFNADMGGFAVVRHGSRSVDVRFGEEYLEEPVVNATISMESSDMAVDAFEANMNDLFGQDIRFAVVKKSTKGFTVYLNKPAPFDIRFSWMAIAVKDARTFGAMTPPAEEPVEEPTADGSAEAQADTPAEEEPAPEDVA